MKNDGVAAIKVVGIGGAGCNIVDRACFTYLLAGKKGRCVEHILIDTDQQMLEHAVSPQKIAFKVDGLSDRSDGSMARRIALEHQAPLAALFKDARLTVLVAGLGGGIGTGATPIVARVADEAGSLTICLVTTPFTFEEQRSAQAAASGLRALHSVTRNVVVYSYEQLRMSSKPTTTVPEVFARADDELCRMALCLVDRSNYLRVNQGPNVLRQLFESAGFENYSIGFVG